MNEIQKLIKEQCDIKGWTHESPFTIMLLLTEEVGELARAIREKEKLYIETTFESTCETADKNVEQDDVEEKEVTLHDINTAHIEEELADVINYIVDIANFYNINLDKAVKEKMDKNYGRVWDNRHFVRKRLKAD